MLANSLADGPKTGISNARTQTGISNARTQTGILKGGRKTGISDARTLKRVFQTQGPKTGISNARPKMGISNARTQNGYFKREGPNGYFKREDAKRVFQTRYSLCFIKLKTMSERRKVKNKHTCFDEHLSTQDTQRYCTEIFVF